MLTLTEAAKVLGVNPGTLRVQVHNGKLRARKVGPIWTVTEREVERYARENRRRCGAWRDLHGFRNRSGRLQPSGPK